MIWLQRIEWMLMWMMRDIREWWGEVGRLKIQCTRIWGRRGGKRHCWGLVIRSVGAIGGVRRIEKLVRSILKGIKRTQSLGICQIFECSWTRRENVPLNSMYLLHRASVQQFTCQEFSARWWWWWRWWNDIRRALADVFVQCLMVCTRRSTPIARSTQVGRARKRERENALAAKKKKENG